MNVLTLAQVNNATHILGRFDVAVMGVRLQVRFHQRKLAGGDTYVAGLSIGAWLPCAVRGDTQWQEGRTWPIARVDIDHLQRTVLLAVEQFVRHEAHEGIRFDDRIIFNPHKEEHHA